MSWNLRRFDALMPWIVGVCVFMFSFVADQKSQLPGFTSPCWPNCESGALVTSWWVVVLAALSGIAAGFGRLLRWPLSLLAAVSWLVYSMWPAALAASYYSGLNAKRESAVRYLALASALIAAMVTVNLVQKSLPWRRPLIFAALTIAFLVVLPMMCGLWVRARRAEQLIQQDMRGEQARELERVRIAREMHDVVAHRVSLMVLHAGALELAAKDERTIQTAGLIRAAGREAMNELRQVLGVLRGPADTEPQPTLADIPRLVALTRSAGVPVELVMQEAPPDLPGVPATVERTAYRVVQEALTNVVKHAGAVATEVSLKQTRDTLGITVQNGPPAGHREHLPSAGIGLMGLRERVELVGGTLDAGAREDGGFALRALLPLDALGDNRDPSPGR